MIIDINAYLGHYPFRGLPHTRADQLVALMDRHGIDLALVSSLHAVFYRDAHQGNRELVAEIGTHADRFLPVATVNPAYVGWYDDLDECVERWGMRAVTLVPEHHGYALAGDVAASALRRIVELDLPLVLTQRFEDRRQRHAWDVAEDLTAQALMEIAAAHPELRFVLSNWGGLNGAQLAAAGLRGRCLIDFARMHVAFLKHVPQLIDAMGIESIAFGTHMPFDYVAPSLVKLSNFVGLSRGEVDRVAWRNAAEFLRIDI